MAYAGVVSLKQILEQLLHTNQYPFSFNYPKFELQPIYHKVCLLQSDLEEISIDAPRRWRGSEVRDLETQIRRATNGAQDLIESFISRQILSSSESEEILGDRLDEMKRVLETVGQSTRGIRSSIRESIYEGDQQRFQRDASWDFTGYPNKNIVGQDEDLSLLKDKLLRGTDEFRFILITGLPGVGKTTLAASIYQDPVIRSCFNILAWATVGGEYEVGEIFSKLLISSGTMGPEPKGDHHELATCLYKSLYGRRYLIVMDDIWDEKLWDKVKWCFPVGENGSRIVLTSCNQGLARNYPKHSLYHHVMQPLDKENSWILLRRLVFGEEPCPPPLEEIGNKIAANCWGFPLYIKLIGSALSLDRTVHAWKRIEDDVDGAAVAVDDMYMKILSLSYNKLPAKLKGCFLYMGGFPKGSEISVSKLIMLWIAEGFLTPSPPHKSLEEVAMHCLNELVDRNLIQILKVSSDGQPKTCSLHGAMHLLAKEECREQKFFLPITSGYVGEFEGADSESRRVSIYENTLVCREDVRCSIELLALVRTFLFVGSDHLYPNIPNCLSFNLLRVLDALAIYFIHFPLELIDLIHLRYLSFTYSGKLPSQISKLQNLQFLIVRRHPKFMYIYTSVLPPEIWNMPQMRLLQLTQIEFPHPACEKAQNSVFLENLQSLSNVDAASCTKEVLQSMPSLKKIEIWVESPGCVDFHVDQLQQLEALKFTVMKPIPGEKIHFLPDLAFPKTLRKLSLSGCGIPWEDITAVGELPCLQVLKLRNSAFRGPRWAVEEGRFLELEFLLLESLDLVHLDADYSHFPRLQRLIIRHCYELEEICTDIGFMCSLKLIQLVDCGPLAEDCARQIRDEQDSYGSRLQVRIDSSWK